MDNGAIECRLLQDAVCINKTAEKYKQYAKQAEAEPDAEDENPKRGLCRGACQVYATWDEGSVWNS